MATAHGWRFALSTALDSDLSSSDPCTWDTNNRARVPHSKEGDVRESRQLAHFEKGPIWPATEGTGPSGRRSVPSAPFDEVA